MRNWAEFHAWAIEEFGFKPGVKVRLTRKFRSFELKTEVLWFEEKQQRIGEWGTVRAADSNGEITVKYKDGTIYVYPWHVLELVEEKKPDKVIPAGTVMSLTADGKYKPLNIDMSQPQAQHVTLESDLPITLEQRVSVLEANLSHLVEKLTDLAKRYEQTHEDKFRASL
jgi:hypothetical protein